MNTTHENGTITFKPDTHERRYIDKASNTFALISAAGAGDLQEKAAEVVKVMAEAMELLAKQGEPETDDTTVTRELTEQSPAVAP
jgi:hypothetical protein